MQKRLNLSTAQARKNNRNKAKLAFEMLETEMDLILKDELDCITGGYYSSSGTVVANDCFFQSLYRISEQLGCGYTVSQMQTWYDSAYGNSSNGVVADYADELTDHFFNGVQSISFSQLQNCINNGQKVVVSYVTASGEGHSVNAFGVSNGHITYWDEQNHTIGYIDPSQLISTNGLLAVSSCGL